MRIDSLVRIGIWDEYGNSPVFLAIEVICLRIFADEHIQFLSLGLQRNESQDSAFDIFLATCLEFLPDVPRDCLDVALEQIYVGEHRIVYPLKHIIIAIALSGNFICVIYKTIS